MRVLYISAYPAEVFAGFIRSGKPISQAAQKFNHLLIQGLCMNNIDVDVLYLQDFRDKRVYCERLPENPNHTIRYSPLGYINIRVLRRLSSIVQIGAYVRQWCRANPDGFLFADILHQYAGQCIRIAHRCGIPVVCHVTDLPHCLCDSSTFVRRLLRKRAIVSFEKSVAMTDYFVLLTEAMNDVIHAKPGRYLVMEGLVSFRRPQPVSREISSDAPFLYTGLIRAQYGVDKLVHAFMREDLKDEKLVLFGPGEYVEEVKRISQDYPNIQYGGILPNEEMVERQKAAKCLVNPRPVSEEYTRYSFPSKNMEYMLSGRPILTTRLPGIPSEYDGYCYFFPEDTVEGIAAGLVRISALSEQELSARGLKNQEFVLQNKSNVVQVRRILEMMQQRGAL